MSSRIPTSPCLLPSDYFSLRLPWDCHPQIDHQRNFFGYFWHFLEFPGSYCQPPVLPLERMLVLVLAQKDPTRIFLSDLQLLPERRQTHAPTRGPSKNSRSHLQRPMHSAIKIFYQCSKSVVLQNLFFSEKKYFLHGASHYKFLHLTLFWLYSNSWHYSYQQELLGNPSLHNKISMHLYYSPLLRIIPCRKNLPSFDEQLRFHTFMTHGLPSKLDSRFCTWICDFWEWDIL